MLWVHVYPLLCLGARAQEGGGAVVPEVLGADVVGGLGGGPLPVAQRRVTTSTSSQTHSCHTRVRTASKHSEHRPQAPEPRSWSGRVHTQAPSRALGAARCPRIVGLPSSRSAGAKEGSSLCKGPSDTEKQGHWQRWGGVHPRPGVGKWAREPLGLGSRQGDGPRPRCWVMRAWESRGWPRSGADALEGPGLAGTLGAKSRVKRSRPVPKSRRSSGQGEQLHPAQGLSTRRTPARPALEVPGP